MRGTIAQENFFLAVLSPRVQRIVMGKDQQDVAQFLTEYYGETITVKQLKEIDPDEWGGREVLEQSARENCMIRRFVA